MAAFDATTHESPTLRTPESRWENFPVDDRIFRKKKFADLPQMGEAAAREFVASWELDEKAYLQAVIFTDKCHFNSARTCRK